MNVSYNYFLLAHNYEICPSWIKCEHYFNCASFSKLFPFSKFHLFN